MKTPDEIKKALECCSGDGNCKKCGYEHDCNMYEGFSILAKDALKYIRQIEAKQSKWISVDERLPEEGIRKVLVGVKHEHGYITDTARYMGQHGWDLSTWKVYNDCVTHWMPIPSTEGLE